MSAKNRYRLLNNSRFYVLATAIIASVAVFAWLRIQIPSDQLFYIRAQQVFGLLAIVYWYVALIVSPIGYVIGKDRITHLAFARRAIGVSAFYFASLHAAIAMWGQLGGIAQLQQLPSLFRWSILAGAVAYGILLVMAATSFDKVVSVMTYRRWKWLHRLVYVGGVLVILHIWSIGTHLTYASIQFTALTSLIILSGLELFRITKRMNATFLHLDRSEAGTLFMALWVIVATMIIFIPSLVQNYHSQHGDHNDTQHMERAP